MVQKAKDKVLTFPKQINHGKGKNPTSWWVSMKSLGVCSVGLLWNQPRNWPPLDLRKLSLLPRSIWWHPALSSLPPSLRLMMRRMMLVPILLTVLLEVSLNLIVSHYLLSQISGWCLFRGCDYYSPDWGFWVAILIINVCIMAHTHIAIAILSLFLDSELPMLCRDTFQHHVYTHFGFIDYIAWRRHWSVCGR